MQRISGRDHSQFRNLTLETNINLHAEGSCLISLGNTKVICTASIEENTPRFLKDSGKGWLTAQYGMLPRSTNSRMKREAAEGKQSGRTQEIQRLIGRSLRAGIDLTKLGERQVIIDCDVIQADGGTRTAAINGGFVALRIAVNKLLQSGVIKKDPITCNIAAISAGLMHDQAIIDLDYLEDSNIDVDANFVISSNQEIIEVQASAEGKNFSKTQFDKLYNLASNACMEIFKLQDVALKKT
jgi:ribonuclease PH